MNILKAIIIFVMEILETIVFVGSIFIVVYLFILQPNQIKGASMEPTFENGDYIFTSKMTYKLREPIRGDVVVFHAPRNPDLEYIKRIIGLPGDTILIENEKVYVNGQEIIENYISDVTTLSLAGSIQEGIPLTVPENYYFVMGDNRPRSSDSREFGAITYESIIGQVIYRYFPFNKMGVVDNPLKTDNVSLSLIPTQ
ncbi:MAG TPA: signal peptidase I [Candidatus Woesebacteria bacterium]|nr:signal peptidase I [Candidatus Woesebacteria bacterium]